jgi:hypothetical protein
VERALGLELEHADPTLLGDPVELGRKRSVAVAGHVLDVLEEVTGVDAGDELLFREEPVLPPVLLTRPLRAGGR